MNLHRSAAVAVFALAVPALFSTELLAKPEACAGISEKCTTDVLYDKSIGGTVYSCYDCKQALCKDGGSGGLAGTSTSSVCTEKATSFTPITDDDLANDAPTELAPEPDAQDSEEDPASVVQFGEFTTELVIIPDSECSKNSVRLCANNGATCGLVHDRSGKATDVCRWASKNTETSCKNTIGIWTTATSKYARNHPDSVASGSAGACITEVKNVQGKMTEALVPSRQVYVYEAAQKRRPAPSSGEKGTGLVAPSNLAVSDVRRTTLTLTWTDNSDGEYGVEVYRVDPVAARQDRANGFELIGVFEERVDSNVKGTGARSDKDYELAPGTNYCYRLRAYVGFDRKQVSDFSENVCTVTNP